MYEEFDVDICFEVSSVQIALSKVKIRFWILE